MIVDDLPDNLHLLRELLDPELYRVLAFTKADRALRSAERNIPDLVLLDITMPEMDGFEVCRRLKEHPQLRDIPVLFISAISDPQEKVKAFSCGGRDFITKPFHAEEVRSRVETHLELHTLKREIEHHNDKLQKQVQLKAAEISESQIATIIALSELAESRDDETGHHIERTRLLCRNIAGQMQAVPAYRNTIDNTFVRNLYQAASLHDIGKVGIPDSILRKPGKLTDEEFSIMKTHTVIGSDTLGAATASYDGNAFLNMGKLVARSHHERYDGRGYPDRLSGEDIPLPARIMAVADVYDALRSERPYKHAFSHEYSVEIIRNGRGTQFDPGVVDTFLEIESTLKSLYIGSPNNRME